MAKKEFRNYSEDPNSPPLIIYTRQHEEMTYDGVRNLISRYETAFDGGYVIDRSTPPENIDRQRLVNQGAVVLMTMWEIFELLPYVFDATDPDNYWNAQDLHSIQVGLFGGSPKNEEGRMLRLFGFAHDISKAVLAIDMADQLVVGGDVYPLGVAPREVKGREGKDMVPYWNHGFEGNADWKSDLYPHDPQHADFDYGVYADLVRSGRMKLSELVLMFQHDTHLGIILDRMRAEDHRVSPEWMERFRFLARYHSFHAFHDFDPHPEDRFLNARNGPYYWAAGPEDRAMLESGIPEKFKNRDLYTKLEIPDLEAYRREQYPEVKRLFAEFFPQPVRVPILSDRLLRFLGMKESKNLAEILGFLSSAVRFNPEGGVVLMLSENERPFKGELCNGFMELLRLKAKPAQGEPNPDLLRMYQEIAHAHPRGSRFYGIGEPIEEALKGFNPVMPRSPELTLAIAEVAARPRLGFDAAA